MFIKPSVWCVCPLRAWAKPLFAIVVVPLSQHLPVAINPRPWAKRCTSGGASLPVEPRSSYSSLGSLSAASFSRRFAPDADLCGTRHVAVSSQPLQPLERHVPVHDARARAVNPLHSRLAVCCAQQYSWLATVFDVLTILSTPSQCSTFAALDILATLYAAIIDAANSASSRPPLPRSTPAAFACCIVLPLVYAERGFAARVCAEVGGGRTYAFVSSYYPHLCCCC